MGSFKRRNTDWQAFGQWRQSRRRRYHKFWVKESKEEKLEEAVAEIRRKYGQDAIKRGDGEDGNGD